MKLAISNIAWNAEQDKDMYAKLQQYGFDGLEIAPTRIFPDKPYEHNEEAADFAEQLKKNYGLSIPSMHSVRPQELHIAPGNPANLTTGIHLIP